ncbi:endonuclease/exonuclease/phosphatase family protein [Bacteriovorax sp. Seq25_V]|uniref:endonuclease/exonuclease/phosphatase family protein n=1 Tax=Bacteriovorax sp. Seq25_V TaxID=1201288 RepID=UPI000389EFEA|nr:endonuclease/exonuclease/phosphatase family protein [Bacteriovorax sp. Seq25_V]EQC47985.1 endonuclease/exonuclease/phosphatase family protein [Bacteriovorax sp. Seq25_V]
MKKIIITVFAMAALHANASLKITSFNLKWFGSGGELSGKNSDEYRAPWLSEFIAKYLSTTEVILFQEVVDTQKLINLMASLNFDCHTYLGSGSRHQHLVLCHTDKYSFSPEEGDDNNIFEDIATINGSKLRPAISGVIKEKKSKKFLAHVLGVHLKAGKREGQMREIQTQLLTERIKSYKDKLPVILLGDFNSYPKEFSGAPVGDLERMDELYQEVGLKRVKHNFKNTFKSFNYGHLFDHFWISNQLNIKSVDVFEACNNNNSKLYRYRNLSFYNRFISDHCPITVEVQ